MKWKIKRILEEKSCVLRERRRRRKRKRRKLAIDLWCWRESWEDFHEEVKGRQYIELQEIWKIQVKSDSWDQEKRKEKTGLEDKSRARRGWSKVKGTGHVHQRTIHASITDTIALQRENRWNNLTRKFIEWWTTMIPSFCLPFVMVLREKKETSDFLLQIFLLLLLLLTTACCSKLLVTNENHKLWLLTEM